MRALLPVVECRSVVGVERFPNATYGHEYHVSICRRWKGHLGPCMPHTRHSMIESYYEINRSAWPDMSRRRALWSAWRCWRMTREHVDRALWFSRRRDTDRESANSVQNGGT